MTVQKKGFTLVELLVTISIIAILSAIGLVLYSTVLKQGRDSKRQSDLKSIQLALEQYVNDQGFYPAPSPSSLTPGTGALTTSTGNPTSPAPALKTYMSIIPNDSNSSTPYVYVALKDGATCNNSSIFCTSYCLYAKLENLTSPDLKGCSVSGSYSTYNFAVTPP
ncbi:hypothetical protein A3I48_03045 [Candidatus Daviesbacteria bacterium RIFCSPLOWO2_02_FULL_36_7]|uniref:Type II secretion system protein GspG C-terminal domain-containing protein n=1 Tax=Candidatus Daviesbacteria bacterium RIFCSPLOWO2_02_FULL_36_7 TaxID=1797792 RepID=A0A1F5MGC9_9BACT|nr:MAG: hypothetical protein A3I48_03045 [Candidatus Daviesbacteria bacterium RIFCSPLOWO2_02_FULL_36_7]